MHDMVNLYMDNPRGIELNRATWIQYCGGNYDNGGIYTQLCGWKGTPEVFTRSIGDSDYVDNLVFWRSKTRLQK